MEIIEPPMVAVRGRNWVLVYTVNGVARERVISDTQRHRWIRGWLKRMPARVNP